VQYRARTAAPAPTKLEFAEHTFQSCDDQTAVKLFSELASNNSEYWLGHMNAIGLGIPRDVTKDIGLDKKAAEQNIVAADARLG
jgi:TPR repeat protein